VAKHQTTTFKQGATTNIFLAIDQLNAQILVL